MGGSCCLQCRAAGSRGSRTWLFYHAGRGLSTGVFTVLESDDTVFLILIGTVHHILASVLATHCIKRPRPPSPTSPTGALNDEQAPADHCQTVPGPWVSLQSCLQGRIPVGRAGGWEWGGLEECQYVGRCARVCVCVCVRACAAWWGMCPR